MLLLLLQLQQLGDHHRRKEGDWVRDLQNNVGFWRGFVASTAARISGCEDGCHSYMAPCVTFIQASTWWQLFEPCLTDQRALLQVQSLVLLLLPLHPHPLYLLNSTEGGGVEGYKVLSERTSVNVPSSSLCHFPTDTGLFAHFILADNFAQFTLQV
ncbi:hypothetical protein XELAEV_18003765mg [Xenopus laevis]|nr:hypothetical protein XELAEV_18003765mg [Xenopus laevis]